MGVLGGQVDDCGEGIEFVFEWLWEGFDDFGEFVWEMLVVCQLGFYIGKVVIKGLVFYIQVVCIQGIGDFVDF